MPKLASPRRARLDLRSDSGRRLALWAAYAVIVAAAVMVRVRVSTYSTGDSHIFGLWWEYLRAHGIAGFRTDFGNYNPPYSYLLYLTLLLHLPKMAAIKGIAAAGDVLFAYAVYRFVRQLRPHSRLAWVAGLASLFIPTVIWTGVLWGQIDQIYTGFLLLSLTHALRSESRRSWLFFGLAFSFKLQAVFFLPVLLLLALTRIAWWDAGYAVAVYLLATLPPALAGRSIGSLLGIYVGQAGAFNGQLTANAPNVYEWLPSNTAFSVFGGGGIWFCLAALAAIAVFTLTRKTLDEPDDVILLSALVLFTVPFLLPEMHERYFFPAGIACLLAALVRPWLFWVAVALQVTTMFSYGPFVYHKPVAISFTVLALVNLAILGCLAYAYVKPVASGPRPLDRSAARASTTRPDIPWRRSARQTSQAREDG